MDIIGMGIDIVEIERFRKIVKRRGDAFLEKIFTADELEKFDVYRDPTQHMAVRFAAKEAVFKAVSSICPKLTWHQIVILKHPSGQPFCKIRDEQFIGQIHISLTHSQAYAAANAIATYGY